MEIRIGIIGLGYVGLPLAVEFGKKYNTIGFDINKKRVEELNSYYDNTNEIESKCLKEVICNNHLNISSSKEDLVDCNYYIITVPTPITRNNTPDINPLIKASELIGEIISKNDIIIYESTVYPGLTEEVCVPIIEEKSNLKYNEDFYVGYSPERINPGDKVHTLTNIQKIVSGSNVESTKKINKLYSSIITAGTYIAPSIKVAEAAKVIENTQRDVNIAFVNELSKIFNLMEIDTYEVLKAANTKWNFLDFKPGLVGGHCIGVDPYYLAHKAQELGYHPEIILSGRRMNDSMSSFVSETVIKKLIKQETQIKNAEILVLGLTFKENCPDLRNSKVFSLIESLSSYGTNVKCYDPLVDENEIKSKYNVNFSNNYLNQLFDVIILAVNHSAFKKFDLDKLKKNSKSIIFDIKGELKNYDCRL